MKGLKKALLTLLLLLVFACGGYGAGALGIESVSNFSIEQTYVNVPELDIFLYALDDEGNSISPSWARGAGVEATLGNYDLDTSNISMAAEPICYTFLLDNSRTMDVETFRAYRNAIMQVARTRGDRDQIVVYTMAGTPQRVLDESATNKDLYRGLQKIGITEESCDLLGAARQAVADTNTYYQSLAPRKVLFVCTSGVEVLSNPALVAGLSSNLIQQLNMALYAFAASPSAEKLTVLSTLTGNKIIPCETKNLVSTIRAKQDALANALEIKTTVPASMGGQRLDTLTISVPYLGSAVKASTTVLMTHIQAKPEVTGISVDSRTQMTLTFNQAVNNADKPRNYTIKSEDVWGWQVEVKNVSVSQDGRTAVLTTEPLYSGSYGIRLNKVSSRMTAANQSDKTKTFFPVTGWAHDKVFYVARFRLPALVLVALLAVLAVRAVLQSRRERQKETAAEVQHLLAGEGAPNNTLPKRWLTLFVQTRGELLQKKYSALVEGSIILGSEEALCDICIQDHRLKPQHCILWVEGEDVYIRALDKNTVVLCNKERIGDAHRLNNNDVIKIGRTAIQLAL